MTDSKGLQRAVKIMRLKDETYIPYFRNEISLTRKLANKYGVVSLSPNNDCIYNRDMIYLSIELYESDLTNVLISNDEETQNEFTRNFLWLAYTANTIVDSVVGMHGSGVVHADLKTDNVFVRKGYDIVIGDLGFSKKVPFPKTRNERPFYRGEEIAGTEGFKSPELKADAIYSRESDVYALGVVIFQLFFTVDKRTNDNAEDHVVFSFQKKECKNKRLLAENSRYYIFCNFYIKTVFKMLRTKRGDRPVGEVLKKEFKLITKRVIEFSEKIYKQAVADKKRTKNRIDIIEFEKIRKRSSVDMFLDSAISSLLVDNKDKNYKKYVRSRLHLFLKNLAKTKKKTSGSSSSLYILSKNIFEEKIKKASKIII